MPNIENVSGENTALRFSAAPSAGTSEVQTITVTGTPTGGTFKLKYRGRTTTALVYNAADTVITAALEALSTIGSGGVVASGTLATGTTVTFAAQLGKQAVQMIEPVEVKFTGGTAPAIAVVETTPGVTASGRGAAKGQVGFDAATGTQYTNTGTATAPTWTETQTHVVAAAAADGAVTIPNVGSKTVFVTKAGVCAMTLGTPTTAQNGVSIVFMSTTANAHTVTCATIGFNAGDAAKDVATFGAAIGNNFQVEAYAGEWYVIGTPVGVTLG
jgi:hypothetical protein